MQSSQSSEQSFLLQTAHAGPGPPTPASQSLGLLCLSHPGLLLLCVRFSSQLVVSTLIKVQASQERAGLSALQMERLWIHTDVVCVC